MTRPIHEYAAELTALQQAINKVGGVSDTDFWHGAIVSLEIFDDLGGMIIVSLFPADDKEFDIGFSDSEAEFDANFDAAVKNVLEHYGCR